jgi:hydrogenase-4 component B
MRMLLLLTPLLPLALIPLLTFSPRLALKISPWAALPGVVTALALEPGETLTLDWLLLGVTLGLDETGRVFLLFSSILWLLAGLYARAYLATDARRRRFSGFFLLTMAGNLALPLALDLVTFYLAFALMTFAAFGLIVHQGSPEAHRAGRFYLVLAVVGEGLLLAGLLFSAAAAGSLALEAMPAAVAASSWRGLIVTLVLMGFGVKAGVWLLHVWLPLAHPVAPTPASAVLSGAMIKAGLLGWLRFLPLGEVDMPIFGALCLAAGLAAAYWGVVCGVSQEDPKTVLAYSSISQMGLITVALGSGLLSREAWPLAQAAILVYALHHAFAKGSLFLGVGLAGHSRLLLIGLGLPALALVGLPLTSGALAKAALKEAMGLTGWAPMLGWALPLAAAGTALLMARFLFLLQQAPTRKGPADGLLLPWLASLLAVAAGTSLWSAAFGLLPAYGTDLWEGLWPLLLGLLAFPVSRKLPRIAAGDVLALYEAAYQQASRGYFKLATLARQAPARLLASLQALQARLTRDVANLAGLEPVLTRWNAVGFALLLLALLLLASLGWDHAR